MLSGILAARILENVLSGSGVIRAGEGVIRAGFLMPPHPLTNFGIRKYYQNKPKFVGVKKRNSRNN